MKKLLISLVFLFSFALVGLQCTSQKDIIDTPETEYAYITNPVIKKAFATYMAENKEFVNELVQINNIPKETIEYIIYSKTLNEQGFPIISFKTYMNEIGMYNNIKFLEGLSIWLDTYFYGIHPFGIGLTLTISLMLLVIVLTFKTFPFTKRGDTTGKSNKRDSS
jgi:hypothetical protein